MSSLRLAELSWPEVRALVARDPVGVIPVGAFEQHGPHLPLMVDAHLAETVALGAARQAAERGVAVAVTPVVWTGYSPHHRDFPGTVTLDDRVFSALVGQVAQSLWRAGFRRILILNGHGGNAHLLRNLAQTLRYDHGLRVHVASYWDFALSALAAWRRSAPGGINHACEMETALMAATRPDLVRMDLAADHYPERPRWFGADLLGGGPVTAAVPFAELSPSGVIGAPTLATPERGAALLAAITGRVAEFLADLAGWPGPAAGAAQETETQT
jgi:creatinine amidohydrolase